MTPEMQAKLKRLFHILSDAVYDWATNNDDEDHERLEGIVNQLEESFPARVMEIVQPKEKVEVGK